MANLIINVRCTCEEEFLLLHKLHKLYQEDQLRKRLKERLVAAQGNGDGTVTETVERTFVAQAVDGGIDALGNPPLPEKPLTVDEARAIGAGYAEQEERIPVESNVHKSFAFEEEPVPDSMWKKPEITLTDVLEAEALENAEKLDA